MGNFRSRTECGDSWLNPALLRWAWHNRRFSLRFSSLFSLAILTLLILNDQHAWLDLTSLSWFVFLWSSSAISNGFTAVVGDRLRLQMAAFLLIRPVSRRQLYNQMILEKLVPVLLPGLTIALYVLTIPLVRVGFHNSLAPATLIVLAAVSPVAYLLGVWAGIYSYAAGNKVIRRTAETIVPAVGIAFILGMVQKHPWIALPARLPAAIGPVLVMTGLALAAGFYHAGWRLFRKLDLDTGPIETSAEKRSMERNKTNAGPSQPNPALLRWLWKRNRLFYLVCLAVSLGFLTGLVLRYMHKAAWPDNLFLIASLWAAYLGGANAVWSADKTIAFLLARPVSRRQAYNIQVTNGIIPWLLVGAIPAIFAAVFLARAPGSSPNSTLPIEFYFIYIIWTLALYLTTIYLAASGKATPKNAATNIHAVALLILIILASSTTSWWTSRTAMGFVSALGPVPVVVGLAVAVWSYRSGWRLYRNLDF